MKNIYSITGVALALLMTTSASAQDLRTFSGGSQRSSVNTKAHGSSNNMPARVRLQEGAARPQTLRGVIPNDLCTDAIALTMNAPGGCPAGGIAGTNAGANNDGGDPSCDVSTAGFEDVWYAFNSGLVTSATIDITPGDIADLLIEVFEVDCNGSSVYCDFSVLTNTFAVTPNTDYVVRLASNNDFGAGGTFDICLSGVTAGDPPANDECADAISMTVGVACVPSAHTMTDATQSLEPNTCSTFVSDAANDVWFSFTAIAGATIIEVTSAGDTITGVDPVLEVYSGNCAELVSLGCVDATVRGGTEQITLVTDPGTTYYYRVYSWVYAAGTPVADFTTCVYSPENVPANDECSNVVSQSLTVGGSVVFNGDNTGALNTEGLSFPSVWESFTTTECTFLELSYCGTTPPFDNAFLGIFTGCPATGGVVSSSADQTTCADGNITLFFEYVPAGTYYYAVLTTDGATGPYTITVSATACPAGYCTAGADGTDLGLDERIINVNFAGINNDSPDEGPVAPAYSDFTAISGTVEVGMTYTLAVDVATTGSDLSYSENQVLAWIDYNMDEVFDNTELVFASDIGSLDIFSGDVTIPPGTAPGTTRMRIRLHDTHDGSQYTNNFNDTPCGISSYGEVEDYSLNMEITIGTNELTTADWSVYPNPSNGDFTIRFGDLGSSLNMEVLDNTGRLVHTERFAAQQAGQKQVALSNRLATGAYVLRMTSTKGRTEQRIVIR